MNGAYENSIGEIAAGLAHDIKNPLALVGASIDLLELNDRDGKDAGNFGIIRRELERINELMLDFLQLSNPEFNFEEFGLAGLLGETVESFRSVYGDIEFTADYGGEEYTVNGDMPKLRRVFGNILKNAVEAVAESCDGGGRIDIGIKTEGNGIVTEISDNGKGLSEDELRMVSKGFYTSKTGGTGIGLYISRMILERHGGGMEISGTGKKGCRVRVFLPLSP